jgi:hypothetical protein
MLYHIWPNQENEVWKWNIQWLRHYINQFDGVRSVAVAVNEKSILIGNPKTATLEEVQKEFEGVRIDNWIQFANNPGLRECITFIPLMETLPRNEGITWYGHAKGVRHTDYEMYPLIWASVMYQLTLGNEKQVMELLEQYPFAGCFRRHNEFHLPKHHVWHYSGTYFWFRNADIFARDWADLAPNFFAGVEAWPSRLFPASETGCIFNDNAGNLYDRAEWLTLQPILEQQYGIKIQL